MLKIGNIEISNLCLGGGKMVGMDFNIGRSLVNKALDLSINVFDCHHRYGNCEKIVGSFGNIIKMTKVSAYKPELHGELTNNSRSLLKKIDIFWISDLDSDPLYQNGIMLYSIYQNQFNLIGINTENPELAYRFMEEVPSCNLFMIPLSIEQPGMISFIKDAKARGKIIFIIKIFRDGLLFPTYSKEESIKFVKKENPNIILLGTSKEDHLEELVNLLGD